MADDDLDKIRQQRLAQLQAQYGGGEGIEKQKAQEEQVKAVEDAKNSILAQILSQSARARLNTIKISKPEKAQMVEQMLVRMAQNGQLRGQIDEPQLIELLQNVNQQMPQKKTSVKFDRRRAALDSDDEF
ncbi:programmed cell death protein 5-like [Ctenocephalides felis]|uniref:programmed cell death protein 5-like n=1 Tax=Ctenocephalides felis TaxID=7515 RepID=UPI000E6E3AF9|nr:programmed cell death protein 5-like [Ctenocephalides felis]